MIVDAHQHFWKLDLPFDHAWLYEPQHRPICRDYLPSDLAPLLRAARVDRTVFVQTQHDPAENRWALQLARDNDWIAGVVGWVDLSSEQCEQQLQEFLDEPRFVGIRHITQGEPDDDFIVRPDVIRGLQVLQRQGMPFDLLFYDRHLRHAATLGRLLPELPMVIDHLSKPRIRDGQFADWRSNLMAAAEYPQIHCKLSGMVTEARWDSWTSSDLRPYVETALEAFGPSRCMFGSDWPVCELAGTYQQVTGVLQELISTLTPHEQNQILFETANRFYDLQLEDTAAARRE